MRLVLLVLLAYSSTVLAVKCDSYGKEVAATLRSFFLGDDEAQKCEVSGEEQFTKYPQESQVLAPPADAKDFGQLFHEESILINLANEQSHPQQLHWKLDIPNLDQFALQDVFQLLSQKALVVEKNMEMEAQLARKKSTCQAELAKIILEHEAAGKKLRAELDRYMTEAEIFLNLRSKQK